MNCNPNVPHASDFQSILNYLINLAQPETRRVDKKAVALEMELKPDTVQRHANGTIPSNADFARDIIRAIARNNEDVALELISFFVPAGFRIVRESSLGGAASVDIRDQQLDLSRIVGRIQELVKEAFSDGRVDRTEHRAISRKVATLKTIATELDERLRGEVL